MSAMFFETFSVDLARNPSFVLVYKSVLPWVAGCSFMQTVPPQPPIVAPLRPDKNMDAIENSLLTSQCHLDVF